MPQQSRRSHPQADLATLAGQLLERTSSLGDVRLVCIDGPAGSGKTTLAAELAEVLSHKALSVQTLHMDDLYEGWSGIDAGRQLEVRVLDQALRPLANGRQGRWQRYDWAAGRLTEWVDLPVPDVLILEGCGSGALAYQTFITLLVWVEAERHTRIDRGLARDGEKLLPQWLRWMDAEERHFAANGTRDRADVILRTG
jgi:uridine kinase